jgi:phosphoserine phosphatase RsbU/P
MTAADDDTVAPGFIEALRDDDAQTLYEEAPCGYLSTTPDGLIVKVNATFLRLTGYSRDELVGRRRFVELLTVGGRIYHETHYAPMLRMQGTVREIAFELRCADTHRLPVLVNSVLERDAAGQPLVIRAAVFDASHRRRYEEDLLRAKQRAEESEVRATNLARTLQQTLLPPHLPIIAGLDVEAEYRPAGDGSEVGGDFYDVFQVGADDWVVVIGDVCGKGAEAAVVTALARYTLRAAAIRDAAPAHGLRVLNEALRRSDGSRLCTAVVLRFTWAEGRWAVRSCAAGHALPLLLRPGDEPVAVGRPGTLLGALNEVMLVEARLELAEGDAIVAYTDGVTEGRTPGGEFYGEERLHERLAAAAAAGECPGSALLADVLDFQHGVPRDDIAIVAVRVRDDDL